LRFSNSWFGFLLIFTVLLFFFQTTLSIQLKLINLGGEVKQFDL